MIGLDSNILIQLAAQDHPRNQVTRAALNLQLGEGEVLGFPPSVLNEFLHVVTDHRRLTPALDMNEAIAWMDDLLTDSRVRILESTPESARVTMAWLKTYSLGRKRILDTHLAAVLHVNGVTRLLTSDPSDFVIFGVFDLIVP